MQQLTGKSKTGWTPELCQFSVFELHVCNKITKDVDDVKTKVAHLDAMYGRGKFSQIKHEPQHGHDYKSVNSTKEAKKHTQCMFNAFCYEVYETLI